MDEQKYYEGKQVAAIIYIPDNTVKLEIIATMMDEEDKLFSATSTMRTADVMEARIEGDEWEAENVKYCLTDEGRALADLLEKQPE